MCSQISNNRDSVAESGCNERSARPNRQSGRERHPRETMSQETESTATELSDLDLDEMLRWVDEGAPQKSNEILQTEDARAWPLSEQHHLSTTKEQPQSRIEVR